MYRRQPCQMTKAHLLIDIGWGCWPDDKRASSGCYRVDNGGLIPASHRYARVVARWLEVLVSYAGRPNLTMITSGMVLEQLRTR